MVAWIRIGFSPIFQQSAKLRSNLSWGLRTWIRDIVFFSMKSGTVNSACCSKSSHWQMAGNQNAMHVTSKFSILNDSIMNSNTNWVKILSKCSNKSLIVLLRIEIHSLPLLPFAFSGTLARRRNTQTNLFLRRNSHWSISHIFSFSTYPWLMKNSSANPSGLLVASLASINSRFSLHSNFVSFSYGLMRIQQEA